MLHSAKELLGDNFSNAETALAKISMKSAVRVVTGHYAESRFVAKAIYLWDQDPDFFEERGKIYLHLKDYKMAISNFKQALRLIFPPPPSPPPHRRTMSTMSVQVVHEQAGGAETAYFQPARCRGPAVCLRTSFHYPHHLTNSQGLCRMRAKEFAEAIFLFSSALEVDPSNLYLHVHHSLALLGQGKTSQALSGLMTYLEADLVHASARAGIHVLVAKLHKQLKNPTTAAHHIHLALNLEPQNPEALLLYTQLKGRAGELYDEATDFLLRNEPQKVSEVLDERLYV
eukprot:746917-Hanusia_phi.AAC.1